MNGALNWQQARSEWPHNAHSKFIQVDNITWHVQSIGEGPEVLLVHGTGASTHSWAELASALSQNWKVVMMDLPGHGFTTPTSSDQSSLSGMASGIGKLVNQMRLSPKLVVGHSAGAAILAQMCLDQIISPDALVSFNGALLPFNGLSGKIYSQAAKVFASTELIPWFFSRRAKDETAVERLINHTGSKISKQSTVCYHRLLRSQSHVSAALRMMANWDLEPLYKNLHLLKTPLHLVACTEDSTVPINQARRIHRWTMHSFLHEVEGLGHLGHEERPDLHYELLENIIQSTDDMLCSESSTGRGKT